MNDKNLAIAFRARSLRRIQLSAFGLVVCVPMLCGCALGSSRAATSRATAPVAHATQAANQGTHRQPPAVAQRRQTINQFSAVPHSATSPTVHETTNPLRQQNAASNQPPPVASPQNIAQPDTSPLEQYDAVQVAYQQPVGRTYSNPSPPGYHRGQPYGNVKSQATPYETFRQPQGSPASQPPLASGRYQEPVYANETAPAIEPPLSQSPVIPVPEQGETLPMARNGSVAGGYSRMSTSVQPIDQYSSAHAGGTLTQLGDGINVGGSELRQRTATATERALQLQNENEALRQKLAALNMQVVSLQDDVKARDEALLAANRQTSEAHRTNAGLRDSIAGFKVKLRESENEKRAIEQNADLTLKEIESTLDAVLLNTLSNSRKP